MINKVILVGHLGKDPEVRHLDQNRAVANVTIATNERYNDRNGNKVEQTEWHNLEMWDGLAKVAEQYLKKGMLIYVEGKLKTDEWEKDGVKRYTTRIRVNTMNMLSSAERRGPEVQSTPTSQPSANETAKSNEESFESLVSDEDDDLPF